MKTKARETVRPIPAVYHEELQALATRLDKEEIAAKLPSLSQLKTSLKERIEANSITLHEFVRAWYVSTHKHMKHLDFRLYACRSVSSTSSRVDETPLSYLK